jgi:hypothetical protein
MDRNQNEDDPMNSIERLDRIMKNNLGYYNAPLKKEFHTAGRAVCRKIAQALGLEKGTYDIRSNQGGIAVSGEITLHSERLYLQISESVTSKKDHEIMFRHCSGRKDYTGGRNHWASTEELLTNFDETIRKFRLVSQEVS